MARWAIDKKRPVDAIFPERRQALTEKKCLPQPLGCGKPATSFKDGISAKEYNISGFCQACQDAFFNGTTMRC